MDESAAVLSIAPRNTGSAQNWMHAVHPISNLPRNADVYRIG